MEINGLPVHALAIHGAVVFGPLSALTGLAYAVPKWRDRLRVPLVVMAAIAVVAIWVAYLSGEDLLESNPFFEQGDLHDLVETHEERAETLRLVMSGFAVVAFLAAWLHTRTGAVRALLTGLVVVGALGTAVWTVLTGDAGAQIAWNGING
jgi:MFS family permease